MVRLSGWCAKIHRFDCITGTWDEAIFWSGFDFVHIGDLWTCNKSIDFDFYWFDVDSFIKFISIFSHSFSDRPAHITSFFETYPWTKEPLQDQWTMTHERLEKLTWWLILGLQIEKLTFNNKNKVPLQIRNRLI